MTTRNLDFSDGFQSASAPTEGEIDVNGVKVFADDSAFAADKGSAAAVGDIYFNSTTGFLRIHNGTAFVELVDNNANQTVSGDKTFDGTTTFIDSTNLEVTDQNITVNKNGNDASSEGAGLTVERTGTDGSIVYEDALAAKWKVGALGSEVEIVTVSGTQLLTGKDIDGGTASNTSRITLPKDTKTNLDGLTRKEGTIVYATDDQKPYFDDGTNLIEVGSGSGGTGINHVTNPDFETTANDWNAYADAAGTDPVDGTGGSPTVTITRNTSSPLRGDGDGVITKDAADRQGEGVSTDFTIDDADLSKPMTISFDYEASANFAFNGGAPGDESDVMVWIYDVTNAALIQPLVVGLDGSGRFVSSFQADAASTSYRLIFHVATTNASAWTLNIDNVQVGPSAVVVTDGPVTDWESWTPTGSWSTNTTYAGKKRRVGDSAEYDVYITTSGAPDATTLTVDIEETIDTDKLAAGTSVDKILGYVYLLEGGVENIVGVVKYSDTNTLRIQFFSENNETDDQVSVTNVSNTNPFTFGSGDSIHIRTFPLPISGWGTGRVSAVAADSNRPVFLSVYDNQPSSTISSTFAGSGNINWDTVDQDSHAGYSTDTYTIPISGTYLFTGQVSIAGTESANDLNQVSMAVDGTEVSTQKGFKRTEATGLTSNYVPFIFQRKCTAREAITFRAISSKTSPGFENLAGAHYLNITRLDTGSPLAAVTEKVAFTVIDDQPTGTIDASDPDSSTDVIWGDTPAIDTHNAYDNTTGQFTAPVSGTYVFNGELAFGGTEANNDFIIIYPYIDGSQATTTYGKSLTRVMNTGLSSTPARFEFQVDLNADQTFSVRVQSAMTSVAFASFTDGHRFQGRRLS